MKTILWKPIAIVVMVAMALFGMAILPGMAQDEVVTEGDLTIVTGAVQFISTGDIVVAGVVIAPASAFIPADLEEGDLVIISGVLLEEGTLRAVSFEYFDDESEPEVTPEATPEATAEATPEATPEETPEATPEATPVVDCGGNVHPVATSIAATFDVTYEEVMALHCAGNGFGNIVRAYALAEASEDGVTAADLLARHQSGEGWGQIMRESDVHPSELAPGKVLKNQGDGSDEDGEMESSTSESGNGRGNGNGNAGGNGNGGNGNGNGGGNGNGNGNNGGGRGNGNGNGNGGGNGNGNGGGGRP